MTDDQSKRLDIGAELVGYLRLSLQRQGLAGGWVMLPPRVVVALNRRIDEWQATFPKGDK